MNKTSIRIGLAAVAAVLAMAGCQPVGTAAHGTTAPGGPATPSGAPAASPSASAPPAGQPAPEPQHRGPQRCHTADLAGHVQGHGAGMGQRYAALGLTNKTSTACTIEGYPGLQFLAADGTALRTTTRRNTAVAPKLLVVKPGQTVWAVLQWTVVPFSDEEATHCAPDPSRLRVIPPDETAPLTMTFEYGAVCMHHTIITDPFGVQRPVDG
jgi:Protein of unknown function (DUF4232)